MKKILFSVTILLLIISLFANGILGALFLTQNSTTLKNEENEKMQQAEQTVVFSENQSNPSIMRDDSLDLAFDDRLNYFVYNKCNVAIPVSKRMYSEDYSKVDFGDVGRKWEVNTIRNSQLFGLYEQERITVSFSPTREAYAANQISYSNGYISGQYSVTCYQPSVNINTLDEFFIYESNLLTETQTLIIVDGREPYYDINLEKKAILNKWGVDTLEYIVNGSAGSAGTYYLVIKNGTYFKINRISNTANQEIKSDLDLAFDEILFY